MVWVGVTSGDTEQKHINPSQVPKSVQAPFGDPPVGLAGLALKLAEIHNPLFKSRADTRAPRGAWGQVAESTLTITMAKIQI